MRLYDALSAYAEQKVIPMHMPGHKRTAFDYLVGGSLDITEIDGFDNLHDASGLLHDAMAYAAAVWGSAHSTFSVNGSTGGILAAIHTAASMGRGEKIIVARNCHKSVWHAIELCRLTPVWIMPPTVEEESFFGSVSPGTVETALASNPDACLVVLTSPTYEGVLSDVAAITSAAHRRGVPVLVDEAHGAHLGLGGGFPDGAVRAGADVVVQSLHKTLPSLTQTAIVHIQGNLINYNAVLRSKNIFETSSPSYLLMSSCDGCAHHVAEHPELFGLWGDMLDAFRRRTAELQHLRVCTPGGDSVFAYDKSKLILSVRGTSIHGPVLAARLRCRGIEPEMISGDYVLAMTGLGTTAAHLERLAEALFAIDGELVSAPAGSSGLSLPPMPEQVMPLHTAVSAPKQLLSLDASEGKIAAGYLWAYPPGIPLIAPGQRISRMLLNAIEALRARGVVLHDEIEVIRV